MLYAKSTSPYRNGSMKCFHERSGNILSLCFSILGTQLILVEISGLMHNFIYIEDEIRGLDSNWSEHTYDSFLSQTKMIRDISQIVLNMGTLK